ncbi:MAG: HD-GYP domain-containing protein, partial [Ardenticatenaceae bacterium]
SLASVWDFLLFVMLSTIAGFYPVVLPRRLVEITPSVAVNIAAIILFPFGVGVLVPAVASLADELRSRKVWYKMMFNVSQVAVTYSVLHVLYRLVRGSSGLMLTSQREALALLVVGVSYYLLNTTLVVLVVSLAGRLPFRYTWTTNFRSTTWHQVSMVCTGFLLAHLWTTHPWSIILIILPVFILRQAMALTSLLETQTHEAIELLVDTVDARDASTYQHSERVANYSRLIAEAVGLSRAEVERIGVSARLHDLGKVGIGDIWLQKKGTLTPEELIHFQNHAALGANIVARFPVLGVEHQLVRGHHERWDGRGYPDGKAGEQIPRGARIIAVADAFDAMTNDRPYRRALSFSEARQRLRAGAGTQFDPAIVAAALPVLPGAEEEQAPTAGAADATQAASTATIQVG